MAFVIKTWLDRLSTYANRRKLTILSTDGNQQTVTVARDEGEITQEGDAFSAANMNDLETRISNAFTEVETNIGNIPIITVDTAISSTSNNPVRNSVINTALSGKANSSHTHGNITNAGALQTTDVGIANGDKLVVTDASNSHKIARTSVSFDGSTTSQYLSKKGTWQSIPTIPDAYTYLPKPNMSDQLYYKDGPEIYRYPTSGTATQDLFISFNCYRPAINGTALDSDMLSGVMYLKRGQYFSCTVRPDGTYNKIKIYSVTF